MLSIKNEQKLKKEQKKKEILNKRQIHIKCNEI